MRRIIIAAILTVISAVGVGTSFAVNDLPNFGEWMKTNEQQFRKPHRHDGSNMHMDQHMMDGNNQMMPQDGMGQMPQGGQPNGNAPQPPVEQGAPQTTQNL
ncbi:MAG: transcriptional regulator [Veillonella sp.]|uniref:transcriptional regulator n=1 Tax=Veillonella sp. TaxID=1926307 RepID=UPI00257EC0C0|nr:transcriptional regulator [Veillonella sp.]MBS5756509.1 transcriptional regulator [Veillonella sp.]